MKIDVARPKLTLSAGSVQANEWITQLVGSNIDDNDFSAWDYHAHVRVQRQFRINHAIVAGELNVDCAEILLVLRRGTGYGQTPRAIETIASIPLRSDIDTIDLDESFGSEALAGELWLLCDIVLARRPVGAGQLSPMRPGARLWSDTYRVTLEPDARRFPTEVVHFSGLFPGRAWVHAPWFVHWSSSDPAQEFASAVRLYINADRTDWVDRIQSLDPLVLQPMMADVMSQVIERVGLFLEGDDEETGSTSSIGSQAIYWRELAFGQETVAALRTLLERRPGEFRAAVLAAAELHGQMT